MKKSSIMWRGKWRRDSSGSVMSVAVGILVLVRFLVVPLRVVGFFIEEFSRNFFRVKVFRVVWLRRKRQYRSV